MIESVQARQRGAYDFESHYDNLCALQDSVPLAAVKANLSSGILDINADKVRTSDWPPIIHTLQINKSLEYVAIRSTFTPPSNSDEKRVPVVRRKTPSIRSKEITFRLCKALQSCLAVTPTLMFIELTGVPLRERDLNVLMKGVLKNTTLVHLSFELCRIGDTGLERVCKGLRGNNKITSINLSGCSLSAKGAEHLARLIKYQAMKRHTEAWRDSLRYGLPQLDKMPGLRRVILNNNPLIGNQGTLVLADALKDDLWLKALDMQGTGVSTSGAKMFLEVLKYNTTIEVLDLRRNPLIDRAVLHSIMEHLMINCNGKEPEYQWLEPATEEEKEGERRHNRLQKSRRRTTKVLNSSIGKKTTIKVTPSNTRRRTRSASAMGLSRQAALDNFKPTPGLPWRTAARANRYRGCPPEQTPRRSTEEMSEVDTSVLITQDDSCLNQSLDTATAMKMLEEDRLNAELQRKRDREMRELQVELEQLRRCLKEERQARSKADQKVMQLMMENRRLEDDLRMIKLRSASVQQQAEASSSPDESILESIESSFKQFHMFLDMLREAGLGELITMAGLNQEQMPFSQSSLRSIFDPFLTHSRVRSTTYTKTTSSKSPNSVHYRPSHHHSSLHQDSKESVSPMGHIDNSAYLKEKKEADELYTRLLRHTSGAFTADIISRSHGTQPVSPLTKGDGDHSAACRLAAAADSGESRKPDHKQHPLSAPSDSPDRDLSPSQSTVKERNGQNGDASSHPVPAPRHRTGLEQQDDGKGDAVPVDADKQSSAPIIEQVPPRASERVSSRASDANYSMDSFEQSYVSEREEVILLGGDIGPLDSPRSTLQNVDSEDDRF